MTECVHSSGSHLTQSFEIRKRDAQGGTEPASNKKSTSPFCFQMIWTEKQELMITC
jgi:hypothetical protein